MMRLFIIYITVHYIPFKKKFDDKPRSLKGFTNIRKALFPGYRSSDFGLEQPVPTDVQHMQVNLRPVLQLQMEPGATEIRWAAPHAYLMLKMSVVSVCIGTKCKPFLRIISC